MKIDSLDHLVLTVKDIDVTQSQPHVFRFFACVNGVVYFSGELGSGTLASCLCYVYESFSNSV